MSLYFIAYALSMLTGDIDVMVHCYVYSVLSQPCTVSHDLAFL